MCIIDLCKLGECGNIIREDPYTRINLVEQIIKNCKNDKEKELECLKFWGLDYYEHDIKIAKERLKKNK